MSANPIIVFSEVRAHRVRKEEELAFYQAELAKQTRKLDQLRREIVVTETIIKLIEAERILTPDLSS